MDNTRNKFIDGDELSESTSLTYVLNCEDNTHQLGPGYEGQLNPPRTHSRLYHHMCLRTDGQ